MFSTLNVPKIEGRKALIIINAQNGAFRKMGKEDPVVPYPTDFAEKMKVVITAYRDIGEVIWVQTWQEERSWVQALPPAAKDRSAGDVGKTQDEEKPYLDFRRYLPSSDTTSLLEQLSALEIKDDEKARAAQWVTDEREASPENDPFPAARKAESGAAILDDLIPLVGSKDTFIHKRFHSAFDQTPLLLLLRIKLVTHLCLCGALSNMSIYSTAADAAQHGFEVNVVEDCIGYRSEAVHLETMQKMADVLGVSGIDSEELVAEAGGRPPPDADPTIFSGPGMSGISVSPPQSQGSTLFSLTTAEIRARSRKMNRTPDPGSEGSSIATVVEISGQKEDLDLEQPLSPLITPPPERSRSLAPVARPEARARLLLGPGDKIGAGDSSIYHQALSADLAEHAFQDIRTEVAWRTMRHRGGEVPRMVAVQGEVGADGSVPIYRHPADESPALLAFTDTMQKIREETQILVKQPFNHVLIQLYRDGQDNISEHSDKTLDIVRGSNIANVSLGAQRTMTLRDKKATHASTLENVARGRQVQRIAMPHNSVFVLGPRTNSCWLHGIRADKRPKAQKLDQENAFAGERISLTFRNIGTFTDAPRTRIWGQGATSKTLPTAQAITASDTPEMEAMIVAFGKENHEVDFDWEAEYGGGFNSLNLATTTAEHPG